MPAIAAFGNSIANDRNRLESANVGIVVVKPLIGRSPSVMHLRDFARRSSAIVFRSVNPLSGVLDRAASIAGRLFNEAFVTLPSSPINAN